MSIAPPDPSLHACLPAPSRSSRVRHDAGWSSPVARQAHNLKVTGSNPVPAPKTSPAGSAPGGRFVVFRPASALQRAKSAGSPSSFAPACDQGVIEFDSFQQAIQSAGLVSLMGHRRFAWTQDHCRAGEPRGQDRGVGEEGQAHRLRRGVRAEDPGRRREHELHERIVPGRADRRHVDQPLRAHLAAERAPKIRFQRGRRG